MRYVAGMDRSTLHDAAGEAGQFQTHALHSLNRDEAQPMPTVYDIGQRLMNLLWRLGFRPTNQD